MSKKNSPQKMREDISALAEQQRTSRAPMDPMEPLKKVAVRVGVVVLVLWVIAFIVPGPIPKYVVAGLTIAAIGIGIWAVRYVKKSFAIGQLLQNAGTDEGRKDALERLSKDYKAGDVQAVLARSQLEMQENPRQALATLESVDLSKQLAPIADQVRALRGMIHLSVGEPKEARALIDKMDLSKQQDAKSRAMFATVASEAWARTGNAKKALETLELFNPEDPEFAETRMQMWRARAFTYAALNDLKGISRSLKKLAEIKPELLLMFASQKKVHPLLEREAKQMLIRSGAIPTQMMRQRG